MYDVILFGMRHKVITDCSQFEDGEGVFLTPERINPVQLFRTDGSVWTSFDISIRIHKEDDVVCILLDHIAVAFGTFALRKPKLIADKTLQALKRPKEDTFQLAAHLFGNVGVVFACSGLFLRCQDELTAIEAIASIIQGLQIAIRKRQQTRIHPALIALFALALQVHLSLCGHEGLYGECDLTFTDELPLEDIDVLFFCTAHGDTKKFMESHNIPEELKIIDLSMDYRIASPDHDFIYGLPELNRRATCTAKHVANPGCFATCIQLGLLPLAKHLMLNEDVMVNAITGSTGAGVKPGATSHFSWRNNNMSVYKAFEHQHVPEIKQSLKQLQNSFDAEIDFIPYRGDFPRGIFATLVVKTKVALEEIVRMYEEYYAKDSFVHIVDKNIDLKQVVNTNKCLIHLEKHGDKLLIISCIDNLLKGASGQAVHNMNLMFNLEETVGLRLKPSAF